MNINPFDELRKNRRTFVLKWVSRTFATGSTFRMLRGVKAEKIRYELVNRLADCSGLGNPRGQKAYDQALMKQIQAVQESISRNKKLAFGHAAKLINLYIKEAVTRRGLLSARQARNIYRRAHVPLDARILRVFRTDFPKEAADIGLIPGTTIKRLSRKQYSQIQIVLRKKAATARCSPLDYDLKWA